MRSGSAVVLLAGLSVAAGAQTGARADLSYLDLLHEGYRLTPAQIAKLETELERKPDDLAARARLISYYFQYALPEPRLQHIRWVIEHRPESRLAGSAVARIEAGVNPLNTRSDYEQIRSLWLRQVAARPSDAAVLGNAGQFFEAEEPARAETLLLRSWQLDRDNKMRLAALARFYVRTLGVCEFQGPTAIQRTCPDPEWTIKAKAGLESSREAELIETVAEQLQGGTWSDPTFAQRLQERVRELRAAR